MPSVSRRLLPHSRQAVSTASFSRPQYEQTFMHGRTPSKIIIGLHRVQAVAAWVLTQPWPPNQVRQVVDEMRRAKSDDSTTRVNRTVGQSCPCFVSRLA